MKITFNHSTNISFQNVTMVTFTPSWNFNALFRLLMAIMGTLISGTILSVILFNRRLRTHPFHIYVINSLTINLISSLVQYPIGAASERYDTGQTFTPWYLGTGACNLYFVVISVGESAMSNTHAFMAASRMWAILLPVSYRSHHTVRFALTAVGCQWVYLWLMNLCLIVPGPLFRRDVEVRWRSVADLILNGMPCAIMLLSVPVILISRVRRARTARRVLGLPDGAQPGPTRRSPSSIVVAILVISFTVFFSPYILYCFITLNSTDDWAEGFYQASLKLYGRQSICDPTLFVVALRPLRENFRKILGRAEESATKNARFVIILLYS
ncbi:hypothetical protein BV898_19299 [Hypsibius exemplaris]|uniref:G-protein coupled receptors family 1 profile domain-containing protein n=1 Tax=Hypsibius exemplaris TaxID=2072580 RepID=A0A9X6NLE1_HYPEX|nr:hypothetical protein BV898_19299 [Hypsibius exemplaris]